MVETTATDGMTIQPQNMKALEKANRVRLERAELKRSIGRGDTDIADVIRHPTESVYNCPIIELLTSQRRWGRTRARKFLAPHLISETKPIGTMTNRQRILLAEELQRKGLGLNGN